MMGEPKSSVRADFLREIHAVIVMRLFRSPRWLAEGDTAIAITRKIVEMGLEERVAQETDTWQATALGKEFKLDLLLVFLGCWYEYEVPMILEDFGLLDEADVDRIYDRLEMGAEPEQVLRPIVRRAFFDHFNPSGRLN